MRILFLAYYYFPHVGGGAITTHYLASKLSERGNTVHLVTPNVAYRRITLDDDKFSETTSSGLVTHRTPAVKLPGLVAPIISGLFLFLSCMRFRGKVDVILSQHHPHHVLTPVSIALGRVLGVPVLIRADDIQRRTGTIRSLRALIVRVVSYLTEGLITRSNEALVTTSEALAEMQRRFPRARSKLGISPNGVDIEQADIAMKESVEGAREALGIGLDRKMILFVGRSSGKEYGLEILFHAIALLKSEHDDRLLVLVGDNLTPELVSLKKRLGLDSVLLVFGAIKHNEVVRFIRASDVCIGPLRSTAAIPLKVLEYFAQGKPVLTGAGSVSSDLAVSGENCLVVGQSPGAVAEGLDRVLANPQFAEQIGRTARAASEAFDWSAVCDWLEQELNVLVAIDANKRLVT